MAAVLGAALLRADASLEDRRLWVILFEGFEGTASADPSFQRFQQAWAHAAPDAQPVALIHTTEVAAAWRAWQGHSARLVVVAPANPLPATLDFVRTRHVALVYSTYLDPVAMRLAHSLSHPGTGMTGLSLNEPIDVKRLTLLREAAPHLTQVRVLADDQWLAAQASRLTELQQAAQAIGLDLRYESAADAASLPAVWQRVPASPALGWYIPASQLSYIAEAPIRAHMVATHSYAMFTTTQEVERGAQLAYSQDAAFTYPALADLTLRVLRGEDPSAIPIERPKRYLLVVRTGKGTERTPLAPDVLRRADVVIGD